MLYMLIWNARISMSMYVWASSVNHRGGKEGGGGGGGSLSGPFLFFLPYLFFGG